MFVLACGKAGYTADAAAVQTQQYDYNVDRDQIVERFYKLSKAGGLIEQAKLPEEVYHNARIYEMRGDIINARERYEAFLKFNLDFIDPHQNYQQILSLQENKKYAVDIYHKYFMDKSNNDILKFSYLNLLDRHEKTTGLYDLIKKSPRFAPAYYELSREHSADKLGKQGWSEKCNEKKMLVRFIELVDGGDYYKYYIDKMVVIKNVEDAKLRLIKLSDIDINKEVVTCEQWMWLSSPHQIRLSCKFVEKPDNLSINEEVSDLIVSSGTNYPGGEIFFYLSGGISEKIVMKLSYKDINNNNVGPIEIPIIEPRLLFYQAIKTKVERGGNIHDIKKEIFDIEDYKLINIAAAEGLPASTDFKEWRRDMKERMLSPELKELWNYYVEKGIISEIGNYLVDKDDGPVVDKPDPDGSTCSRGCIGAKKLDIVTDELAKHNGLKKNNGALVVGTFKDSPADKAGILPGDILTSLNGAEIIDPSDVARLAAKNGLGKMAKITALRNGKTLEINLSGLHPLSAQLQPVVPPKKQLLGKPVVAEHAAPFTTARGFTDSVTNMEFVTVYNAYGFSDR
jgi:hypothetical protein